MKEKIPRNRFRIVALAILLALTVFPKTAAAGLFGTPQTLSRGSVTGRHPGLMPVG